MQRFEGTTIEAALSAAARSLGEGLTVSEARRVRKGGVLGFFAREHYEVLAAPGGMNGHANGHSNGAGSPAAPLVAPEADVLQDAIRSLVEEVESREQLHETIDLRPRQATPPPTTAAPTPESFVPEQAFTQPEIDEPVSAVEEEPIDVPSFPVTEEQVAQEAVGAFYDFEELDAAEVERLPRWSRKALRDLGIPAVILKTLPERNPRTDIGWTQALERAIARHVPAPAALGDQTPAQVSGYGPDGAIIIIRAGASGLTPGALHIDGRRVPATAGELALAVRACLPR
jgi:hypothetical protein